MLCCCDDCWDRFNVLHQYKKGPAPCQRNLPASFLTFENSLVIESGDVYFFRLRPFGSKFAKPFGPINAASTCCSTLMMGHCAFYHYNCIAVPSPETGGGKILGIDSTNIEPGLICGRYDKKRFNDLLKRQPTLIGKPEFWCKVGKGFEGTGRWEKAMLDTKKKLQEDIIGLPGGKSFYDLVDERGGMEAVPVLAACAAGRHPPHSTHISPAPSPLVVTDQHDPKRTDKMSKHEDGFVGSTSCDAVYPQ